MTSVPVPDAASAPPEQFFAVPAAPSGTTAPVTIGPSDASYPDGADPTAAPPDQATVSTPDVAYDVPGSSESQESDSAQDDVGLPDASSPTFSAYGASASSATVAGVSAATTGPAPDQPQVVLIMSSGASQAMDGAAQEAPITVSASPNTSQASETTPSAIKQAASPTTSASPSKLSQGLIHKLARAYPVNRFGVSTMLGTQKVSLDTYLSQYRQSGGSSSLITLLDSGSSQNGTSTAHASYKALSAYSQSSPAMRKSLDIAG